MTYPLAVDTALYTTGPRPRCVLTGKLVNLVATTEAVVWMNAVGVVTGGGALTKTAPQGVGQRGCVVDSGRRIRRRLAGCGVGGEQVQIRLRTQQQQELKKFPEPSPSPEASRRLSSTRRVSTVAPSAPLAG